MAVPDGPRDRPPTFVCRLCGQAIATVADAFVSAAGIAHVLCLEGQFGHPLTDDERSRLIRICEGHEVAVCPVCSRKFRVIEMGADLFSGRYHLCPFCRVDLTPAIRRHIAECAIILHRDPQWQAAVRETLARACVTRKESDQLRDASDLARAESEVLLAKVREAAEAARQAKGEAERIKRQPPRDA